MSRLFAKANVQMDLPAASVRVHSIMYVCLLFKETCTAQASCYKMTVVSQCSTETMFKDLFAIDPSVANGGYIHTNKELIEFTN
jgi:hypothetical protein